MPTYTEQDLIRRKNMQMIVSELARIMNISIQGNQGRLYALAGKIYKLPIGMDFTMQILDRIYPKKEFRYIWKSLQNEHSKTYDYSTNQIVVGACKNFKECLD